MAFVWILFIFILQTKEVIGQNFTKTNDSETTELCSVKDSEYFRYGRDLLVGFYTPQTKLFIDCTIKAKCKDYNIVPICKILFWETATNKTGNPCRLNQSTNGQQSIMVDNGQKLLDNKSCTLLLTFTKTALCSIPQPVVPETVEAKYGGVKSEDSSTQESTQGSTNKPKPTSSSEAAKNPWGILMFALIIPLIFE